MLRAKYLKYNLRFKHPATTSRSTMVDKETYFVCLTDSDLPDKEGIGEVAIFRGLSQEDTPEFEQMLDCICKNINYIDLADLPASSLRFGFETALNSLYHTDSEIAQPIDIPINGLVWMADKYTMAREMMQKAASGFKCIKLKIGGINFTEELELIKELRKQFSPEQIEIRLDANGSFTPDNALARIDALTLYHIHSIEQPIKPRQWNIMAEICRKSPIPIALDEELIGLNSDSAKLTMLNQIKPQYIILKPSLCGGFEQADKWIMAAEDQAIGWWATSALESNIGLEAIARWIAPKNNPLPQGLGTGALYSNNIPSNMYVDGGTLHCPTQYSCNTSDLKF